MKHKKQLLLALALLTTALTTGTLFAYAVSFNPGLRAVSDEAYIITMQETNKAIESNPLFTLSIVAPALLLPSLAFLYRHKNTGRQFKLLVAAWAVYLIGFVAVTARTNYPMNVDLAKVTPQTATTEQNMHTRSDFADRWNRWHTIRTYAVVATLLLLIVATLIPASDKDDHES